MSIDDRDEKIKQLELKMKDLEIEKDEITSRTMLQKLGITLDDMVQQNDELLEKNDVLNEKVDTVQKNSPRNHDVGTLYY